MLRQGCGVESGLFGTAARHLHAPHASRRSLPSSPPPSAPDREEPRPLPPPLTRPVLPLPPLCPAVLRKIASKEEDQLGDTSTLADPGVVQVLLELRGK